MRALLIEFAVSPTVISVHACGRNALTSNSQLTVNATGTRYENKCKND